MKTSLFDFALPESLIAAQPAEPRDSARLLVVDEALRDARVADLPQFLKPGDVMVFNDTRVIPARLFGKRRDAKVEILLHKHITEPSPLVGEGGERQRAGEGGSNKNTPLPSPLPQGERERWTCFAKPAKRLSPRDEIHFAEDFSAVVTEKLPSGEVILQFREDSESLKEKLNRYGHMPLPPYIQRADDSADKERYQTIYGRNDGSVAAPTAGLHFTERLFNDIDKIGVQRQFVTLTVGGGTFLPVKADDTKDHVMHSEYAEVSQETADAVNAATAKGGRVIAVGTTSLRTLESAADAQGKLHPFKGETDIFITPGYQFKIVDMLLTNFHLPRSTLFMLVSAFSGLERMQAAYAHAINEHYRFYSYGDACLLYRQP